MTLRHLITHHPKEVFIGGPVMAFVLWGLAYYGPAWLQLISEVLQ